MARKLEVQIVGDARNFQRSLKSASSGASRFGSTLKRVGTIAAVAFGAGLAAAVVGLKKSFDAAKDAQVSLVKLRAQLRASGLSYAKFGKRIDETIEKQSKLAAVDDEDLQDSFTNILRVVPNVSRALRLNALAADIARAKGIVLAKAGELVGKVAGGNLGILSRYGIVLEEGATKQEALAKLQEKFGGQAKAYGSSVAGAGDRVKVAMENIAETVGEMVFPLAGKVLSAFSDALSEVQKFVDRVARARGFKAKFKIVWTGVREQAENLWNELNTFLLGETTRKPLKLDSGKILEWETTEQQGLVDSIREGLATADWTEIGQKVGEAISAKVRISAEFMQTAFDTAKAWIDSHSDELADLGAQMLLKIINKLLDPAFWAKNWELVLGIAVAVFPAGRIISLGGKVAGWLLAPVAKLLPSGFRGIGGKAVDAILGQLGKLPGRVQSIIVTVVSKATTILGTLIAWLKGKFKTALGLIPGWIRAAFRLGALASFLSILESIYNKIKDILSLADRLPFIGPSEAPYSGRGAPGGSRGPPRGGGSGSGSGQSMGATVVLKIGERELGRALLQMDQNKRRLTGGRGILTT